MGLSWHPGGFWVGLTGGGGGGWLYFWKGDVADEFFRLKLPSDGRGMSVTADGVGVAVACGRPVKTVRSGVTKVSSPATKKGRRDF